jgi:plasmid stabilization system protein ParE
MADTRKSRSPGRGSKASYTDKQKRKAEAIKASYIERGVKPDQATERAWRTVNKQDHGGRKSGSGRGIQPEAAPLRKGATVSWKWGAGKIVGRIVQLFRRKVTRTIKGTEVTRKADPTTPAALVETEDGKQALKSVTELKRLPRMKKTARQSAKKGPR